MLLIVGNGTVGIDTLRHRKHRWVSSKRRHSLRRLAESAEYIAEVRPSPVGSSPPVKCRAALVSCRHSTSGPVRSRKRDRLETDAERIDVPCREPEAVWNRTGWGHR